MKLTAAQRNLVEADINLRRAERSNDPNKIVWMFRSGKLTPDQARILAVLGDKAAQAYLRANGESFPSLRNPNEAAHYIITLHVGEDFGVYPRNIQLLSNILLNLCGQALSKVRNYINRNLDKLDNDRQEAIRNGLQLIERAISSLRTPEEPMSPEIEEALEYGDIFNWAYYWGNPIAMSTSYPSDYQDRMVTLFRGGHPNFPKEADAMHMTLSSLAEAIYGIDSMFHHNPGFIIHGFSKAIQGLIPILGINTVRKGLMRAFEPR